MSAEILLLGHEKTAGLVLASMLTRMDFEPVMAGWRQFNPKTRTPKKPALAIVDSDGLEKGMEAEAFLRLRKAFGGDFPILAMSRSGKFRDLAELIDAGADDCLPSQANPDVLYKKLLRRLTDVMETPNPIFADDEAPSELLATFSNAERSGTLGDRAKIFVGAAPRLPRFRRLAPPDQSWRGVLTADIVERYSLGRPENYLSWNRLHLFRLPEPSEYSVREKVVLRRTGPPLAAAVDRSGLPGGPDVYLVVPVEGIPAGFLCALLNSRLADFYFNRIVPVGDGRLRPETLKRLPVPEADRRTMTELSRITGLLAHYGPHPRNWEDRQTKSELLEKMDELIFNLYGVCRSAREELEALHF